ATRERDGLTGQPDHPLDEVGDRRPRAVLVGWRREHDDVAPVDTVQVVAQLVHDDPVAHLERRFHRARRDGVGGDDEGAQEEGHDQRHRHDAHQLDDPAVRLPLRCSFRRRAVSQGGSVALAFVALHRAEQYYPPGGRLRVTAPPNPHVTPLRHNCAVPEAVIFDFYGTLAHWADTAASYTT